MNEGLIRFFFAWGPSILFISGILSGLIIGMFRGFRKSLILAIQAIAVFVLCLILYFVLVNNDSFDKTMLSSINSVLGTFGGSSLQEILNVSTDCESIKDILVEYIPKSMNFGSGFELVVAENGAYLATLVSVIYHIIFALVFYFLYFILVFILYLIYLIFYPERRYKRKKTRAYRNATSDKPYRRHSLLGGLVGGCRGLVSGLVGISFLGALFFVIGGGIGDKEYSSYEDVQFEQDNSLNISEINTYYEVYKCIGSYGTTGIFKVLNAVKDKDQMPYYLFAADLVFQGGLKDENRGIDENIYLRKEIGAYTKFSMDTFNLVMKYGSKEIADFVNQKEHASNESIMNVIIQIMQQEDFQTEFDQLIDEFDAQTYFVNFSLSLIDSLVYHVDDDITFFNGLDENTKQILKIMFTGEDGIKVSSLLTQEDAKELLKASLAILNASVDNTDPETENESNANLKKTLNYGKVIIPEVLELSILNEEERSKPMNKVLKNLYDYFAVKLEDSNSEGTEINYSPTDRAMKLTNTTSDEIDWVAELKNLLNTGLSTLELYDSIYTADGEMTDKLFEFFAEENTSLEENEKLYDSVTTGLSNSKLLGVIMSMSFMSNMVNEMVLQIIPNAVLPSTFDYANELDDDGNITQYGEVYHLLTTIKFLAKNKDSKTLLESFSGNADKEAIRQISNFLNTDIGENKTMLDQIFESEIFEYAISGLVLNLSIDEGMNLAIYVPQDCRELGREDIPLIVKPELKKVIINLPVLLDIMEKNENMDVNTIVKDDELLNLIQNSRIMEGTVSSLIKNNLSTQKDILFPKRLEDVEEWLSTQEEEGEVLKIIHAIKNADVDIIDVDIKSINVSTEKMGILINSDVLYFTISQNIVDTIKPEFMPMDAYDLEISNIEERNIILKDEILNLTTAIEVLFDKQETGITIGSLEFDTVNISTIKFNSIKNSVIAYKKITDEVETALNDDIPNIAYIDSTNKYYIQENEIKNLITVAGTGGVIEVGAESTTDFSFESIEKAKFQPMAESSIVRYKVSNRLIENENIIVPVKTKEQDINSEREFITQDEFLKFLNAFSAAYGDSEGNIQLQTNVEVSLPQDETKHRQLTDSVIIRATITQNLTISAGGTELEIYAEDTDIDKEHTDTLVLKQDELCRIMAAILELKKDDSSDFMAELDLNQIATNSTPESIYKIASSNVIRLVLNQLIQGQTALFHYESIYEKNDNASVVIKEYVEATSSYVDKEYALEYREISLEILGSVVSQNKYALPSNKIELGELTLYSFSQKQDVIVTTYTENVGGNTVSSSRETLQAYFTMLKELVQQAQV